MTNLRPSKITIAIDGTAGVGKSSVGKAVALKYGISFLSTGQMYRCLGWKVLKSGINMDDESAVIKAAKDIVWGFERQSDSSLKVLVDGQYLGDKLQLEEVGRAASKVSAIGPARAIIMQKQIDLGREGNIVMEGRDIGTAICPDAPVKIYLIANAEARAQRRVKQLQEQGEKADYDEILASIISRDERDSNRSCSPLKPAPDAVIIDTSALSLDEVIEKVMEEVGKVW